MSGPVPGLPFVLDITTSEFSVITKPSKFNTSVPHIKAGGILIFKNFNPKIRFGPEFDRRVIPATGLPPVTGLWTKLLALILCQMRNSSQSSHLK